MDSEETVSSTLFGHDSRVVILGIARMADALGNSFLIVVLPLYIASGEVSGATMGLTESLIIGIIIGIYGLASSVFQPFVGGISDRVGKRQIFVVLGLVIFMGANFMFIYAHTYVAMLVIRIVQGFAAALTITTSLALVSEVSQVSSRGKNMGIYNSFRLIGFGIGPLASGILLETGPYSLPYIGEINGFVAAFCVAALAALLSAILVAFLVEDPEETVANKEKMIIRFFSDSKEQILDPIFTLGIATFIMSTGFALLTSIEPQINARLSQGPFLFSVQFSALVGSLAISQPIIGNLSDRYGRKRFIVIGLICLIPFTLVQGLVTESWHMIAARALQGVSAAMVFAPALALAGDLADKGQVGAQLSVLTIAFGIGISFGAFLSGYAIRFGFIAPFAIGAVLAFIGFLLVKSQVPNS